MLTEAERLCFAHDGFLALPNVLAEDAVAEVRDLLDPLFERFDQLDRRITRDLGADEAASASAGCASARSAEINRPTLLERRLRRTRVFTSCRAIASQVGGGTMSYLYDHAIYKAPYNQRATAWHQDYAYGAHHAPHRTLHIWIPLQHATIENGCMQFIPGSHLGGVQHHERHANGHVLQVRHVDGERAVPCPLRIGGLTIHTPLTLHYTGPNNSATVRRAWILHFGPWGRLAKMHPWAIANRLLGRRDFRSCFPAAATTESTGRP